MLIRDPDDDLWGQWRRWTLRFYAGAFITLGLLAVAYAVRHHAILRIAMKTLAAAVGAVPSTPSVVRRTARPHYRTA